MCSLEAGWAANFTPVVNPANNRSATYSHDGFEQPGSRRTPRCSDKLVDSRIDELVVGAQGEIQTRMDQLILATTAVGCALAVAISIKDADGAATTLRKVGLCGASK